MTEDKSKTIDMINDAIIKDPSRILETNVISICEVNSPHPDVSKKLLVDREALEEAIGCDMYEWFGTNLSRTMLLISQEGLDGIKEDLERIQCD